MAMCTGWDGQQTTHRTGCICRWVRLRHLYPLRGLLTNLTIKTIVDIVHLLQDCLTMIATSVVVGCWVLGVGCWVLGVGCWCSNNQTVRLEWNCVVSLWYLRMLDFEALAPSTCWRQGLLTKQVQTASQPIVFLQQITLRRTSTQSFFSVVFPAFLIFR